MKSVLTCLLLLAVCGFAEEIPEIESLASEDFKERQSAEAAIRAWAIKDDTGARAESIFEKYLTSQLPEEYLRLTKVLLDVHFDFKRDTIPQEGAGFIGISMANPLVNQRLGLERRLGPRNLPLPDEVPLQPVIDLTRGAYVSEVIANTPGEKAGLAVGDLIVAIDGVSIAGVDPVEHLKAIVGGELPGTTIELTIERGEKELKVDVTLMNRRAIPDIRMVNGLRVDQEEVDRLLEQDYLRWLREQRAARQAKQGP